MKSSSLITAVVLCIAAFTSIPEETKAQRVSVNFSVFQSELGRYGRWMNSPRFGQVWVYNEPGFRPYYSNGYWDYSDYGWTWVSDYEWGWAAFHYGRWEFDPMYGWIWIPGYDWAPAWVSWSESGDYYGWAPLGYGVDINISIGSIPHDRWIFCSRPYMNNRSFRDYCAPVSNNRVIVRNTTIINNYYNGRDGRYWKGPGRRDVERYSGSSIRTRQIDNDHRYGNKRWDDDRRSYATRDRNDMRNDNRIGQRDNVDRDRRFDNRNGNNNDIGRAGSERRDNNPLRNDSRRFENRNDNNNDFGRNRPERRETNPTVNDTRRFENRNGNNNNERMREPNQGNRQSEDVRRGRTERTREIRDNSTRPETGRNDNNMRREMPNREQRSFDRPQQQTPQQRQPGNVGSQRTENNRQFEQRGRGGNENNNSNGRGRERKIRGNG